VYWSPNFLAVVFKNQEISHHHHHHPRIASQQVLNKTSGPLKQVVTRMQDLASEFSKKKFPDPHGGRGRPPPALNTQPNLWPGAGRGRPGVGIQTLVNLNFSAVVAPLVDEVDPNRPQTIL